MPDDGAAVPAEPSREGVEADRAPGPDAPPAVAGGHGRMLPGEDRYAQVLDHLTEVVFQTDVAGNWTYLNDAWARMTGYAVEETLGTNFLELVHPDEHDSTVAMFDAVIFGEEPFCLHETRYRMADRSYRWIELRASMLYDDDGAYVGNVGTLLDVDEQHRSRELLRLETDVLRALTGNEPLVDVLRLIAGFVAADTGGAVSLHAAPPAPPVPARHHAVTGPLSTPIEQHVVTDRDRPLDALAGLPSWEYDVRAASGAPLGVLRAYHDTDVVEPPSEPILERTLRLAALAIERWQTNESHWRLSLHDTVTGLPNRALFLSRLGEGVERCRRLGATAAVLSVGLDDLGVLLGSQGEETAADVLAVLAGRLDDQVRAADMVGRVADTEFAVLFSDVDEERDIHGEAKQLRRILAQPVELDDGSLADGGPSGSIATDVSIGIARIFPDDDADAADVLRRAGAARSRAHTRGLGVAAFHAEVDAARLRGVDLAGQLRSAVAAEQLELHYQPKIRLADGSTSGLEALVRWRHPDRGLVSPAEFIPTAERTGIIRDLSYWVLETALDLLTKRQAEGAEGKMAVNLSPRLLNDPDLVDRVGALLHGRGGLLEFELTEHAVMTDPHATGAVMRRLTDVGATFSIDDFGTGYSSLAYLKQLPASMLKIDRSFVTAMDHDERDRSIVTAAINLAHDLDFRVVAEGVETEAVYDLLVDLGCDEAQGYLIARPMAAADLASWSPPTIVAAP